MKPIRTLRRAITWAGLGLAGGALVVTTRHLLSTPQPLESGLTGEGRIARRREGDIYYTVAGPQDAEPLVLLHDFYPGASSYEFRRVFSRLAAHFRLYAPDWLGFGMSKRPALAYTGEFYAHLLAGFLRDAVSGPATVVADGLAGNIAVRAASDEPGLLSRLALVSPRPLAGTLPGPTATQVMARAAQRTTLGLVPYAALATRAGLRWELQRRAAHAGEGAATDDAVDHAYASAHQFGGHHAPLALLIGDLDLPMANVFALLDLPVLVVAGEQDSPQRRLQMEDLTLLNPGARMLTLRGAGDVVHEDQPDAFVERVSLWITTTSGKRAPSPVPAPTEMRRASPVEAVDAIGTATAPSYQQREEAAATITGGIFDEGEPGTQGAATESEVADGPILERFGEVRGLTTPAPGLEALEGLAEQAPELPSGPDFMPLDVAGNVSEAGAAPESRAGGESEGENEESGRPQRGDVQAEPVPPQLERTLEATSTPAAQQLAPDQLRSEMSTPEAPVPTTLAAMTAPLDITGTHEEEGTIEPESGPHPVPADARAPEETPDAQGASEPKAQVEQQSTKAATPAGDAGEQNDVVVLPAPSALHGETNQSEREAPVGTAAEPADVPSTDRPDRVDRSEATRDTAEVLAEHEEQVGIEMQQVDERIRSQAPHRTGDGAPAEAEFVPPHVAAEAEKPARPDQLQRTGSHSGRDAPARPAPPGGSSTPGQRATREGKPSQPAKGARPNQQGRPGTSGQKRPSRKPKHSH